MRETIIFGGTFNPVHNGHVRIAKAAMDSFSADRLIIMPSCLPPHKEASELASNSDRLSMCRLAFSEIENAEVSDFEILRGGRSYTVNTVRHYAREGEKLRLLIGSDMLLSFKKWYLYREILSLAGLIAVSREDGDFDRLTLSARELEAEGGDVTILPIEPFEVSSTEIRSAIKRGGDISPYLPSAVFGYITEKKLYR